MIGTDYVKVSKKFVYELPNPCDLTDFNRAIDFMDRQLVAKGFPRPHKPFRVSSDEGYIYIEVELTAERSTIDATLIDESM